MKNGAIAILKGPYNVPIYAQWNYGKGIVGSFMCDLNGTLSKNLLSNDNGVFLLNKIISGAFSMSNVQMPEKNIHLETPSEIVTFKAKLNEGEQLELILKDSNNSVIETIILTKNDDLEKVISFTVPQTGEYKLVCVKKDAVGEIVYTKEFSVSIVKDSNVYLKELPSEIMKIKSELNEGEYVQLIVKNSDNTVIETITLTGNDNLNDKWFSVQQTGEYTLVCVKKDMEGNILLNKEFVAFIFV